VEQQVCASDSSSVQKMCNFICSCFTCFQRPDEKKHEYNYVPESKTSNIKDNKRNQKSILKQTHMSMVQKVSNSARNSLSSNQIDKDENERLNDDEDLERGVDDRQQT
jgi:hypothetical protein